MPSARRGFPHGGKEIPYRVLRIITDALGKSQGFQSPKHYSQTIRAGANESLLSCYFEDLSAAGKRPAIEAAITVAVAITSNKVN